MTTLVAPAPPRRRSTDAARQAVLRHAPFALRIVRRADGLAAIVYRRTLARNGRDRLTRLAALSPLALTAGGPLLRAAARESGASNGRLELTPGPFLALDRDSGARVACYALIGAGLRVPEGLRHAADALQRADGTEAAWWLGMMTRAHGGERAVRALRILTEAVK